MKKQSLLFYASAMGLCPSFISVCTKPPNNFASRNRTNAYARCRVKLINGIYSSDSHHNKLNPQRTNIARMFIGRHYHFSNSVPTDTQDSLDCLKLC